MVTKKVTKNKAVNKSVGSNGSNRIKKAMEEPAPSVTIRPLNIGRLDFRIRGISSLCVHNFSEKARKQMLESQTKTGTKAKKEPRCPEEEFLGAFYVLDGEAPEPRVDKETQTKHYDPKEVARFLKTATFCVPASGFKNSLIDACRNTDFKMTAMKQTLFVYGVPNRDWVIIESKQPPEMDRSICRLPNKMPIERFRPRWDEWEMTLQIEYDRNMMTADQVGNMLSIAGYYCGICEARPSCSSKGWGRWELA